MSSVPDHLDESPLLAALEKVRWRIFRSLVALLVGFVIGFLLVHFGNVTEILVRPIRPFLEHQDGLLAAFSPLTPFFLELKLALIVGILLAAPVIIYQIWAHFSPVLLPHEKKVIIPALYVGLLLFAMGVLLGYWVLPISLRWLTGFQQDYLDLVIGADEYLSFVVRLLVAFGLVFEIPVVIMILSIMGLVTPAFLRAKRRHSIVAFTVLASLITPGDLPSTFLMMIPMIILYELSIFLSVLIRKREAQRERELEGATSG